MRLVPNFLELAFKIWREPSSTSLLFMDSLFAYARYTDAWVSLSCIFISYAITMRVILTLGSVYHVFLYLTRSLCAFYWHLGQSIMYFYILRDHYARFTDTWVSLSYIFISYAITMRVLLTLGSVYHIFLFLTRSLCALYWRLGQSIIYFYFLRDHYARYTDAWVSLSCIFISYAITMRVLLTLGSVYHIFLFLTRSHCAFYWHLGQSIIYFYFLRDHIARFTDTWLSLSYIFISYAITLRVLLTLGSVYHIFLFLTRSHCAFYWHLGQSIIYFYFLRDHIARFTDTWVSLSYIFISYAITLRVLLTLGSVYHIFFFSYAITLRVLLTLGSVYHIFLFLTRSHCAFYWHLGQSIIYFYFLRDHIARFTDTWVSLSYIFISYAITLRVLLTLGSVYHIFLFLTRSYCAFYWHLGQSIIYFYFLRDQIARFTDTCQTNSLCGTLAPMWLGWTRLWMYCQELIIVICSDQPVSALAKYLRCSKRTNPHTIKTSLRWDTMR